MWRLRREEKEGEGERRNGSEIRIAYTKWSIRGKSWRGERRRIRDKESAKKEKLKDTAERTRE